MNRVRKTIQGALEEVAVIDPHCHLNVEKPSADSLDRVLLYHHVWIELVSSGMGQFEVTSSGFPHEGKDPQMDPKARVRRAIPYLPNIANTVLGHWVDIILRDLYGVDSLTEMNCSQVVEDSIAKGKDPVWQEHVLRDLCHIEHSLSVEDRGTPYSERMGKGKELCPVRLINGKQSPREVLAEWEVIYGREIRDAGDYVKFLGRIAETIEERTYRFVGCWVHPAMNSVHANNEEIDSILSKARNALAISDEELGSFCFYGMKAYLSALRAKGPKTIQLIVGADALLPHRAVTAWSSYFSVGMAILANMFEDFQFSVSAAADVYTQDLAVLARHYPNVSVLGNWWHTMFPFYIRKSLETRLDMVPLNKIVFYFSDAYTSEWCYPKLLMVKQILCDILSDRVQSGRYSIETVQRIIQAGFFENPKRIYRI